ncbi:hypothetical protein [Sphingobacterium sp.]|uniref:hypothetical protein n=1 Tax=Sphingobacterium sp. TaxID=341027 RepID=UPI00289ED5AD|nr:hypothetical protein [Sphingobacterium sp.]
MNTELKPFEISVSEDILKDQLGYIENDIFISENGQNNLVRKISVNILEILLINSSGHFTDH